MMTGAVEGSPSTIADATVVIWSVVKPALAAAAGFTLNTTAGPLVVLSIPYSMSTIGFLYLILTRPRASATRGAHVWIASVSGEKSLTTTGCGAPVRSEIMSCSTCVNSTSSDGSCVVTLERTSLI